MSVISDPDKIALFRLCTLRTGLRLEINGMRRAGRSSYAILKTEYGYRGTRAAVLAAVIADIQNQFATMENPA
jgi:hypothetical protein